MFDPIVRVNKNKCRMVGPQVSRTNTKRQKIEREKRKGLFRSGFAVSGKRADCYPIATLQGGKAEDTRLRRGQ